MSGGGGQSSTNKFEPPDYTIAPWQGYIANAERIAQGGLDPYGGQTVANLSPMMGSGLQMLTDYSQQGTPERSAAGGALLNAMQGQMNPYATAANPYMGNNPYLSNMIDTSNAKITDQYKRVTEPGLNASMARAGAFGGSQWQQEKTANEQNLLGAIGANTNNLLGQNYNQSSQLAEGALNRATGGYDTAQGRALQGAQVAQGQQGLDLSAIQAMIQGGQIPMNYQQQLLNAAQNYYGQQQQAQFTLSDFLGGALGRASGTYGTNTQVAPGQNPWMNVAGSAISTYGLLNS